MHTTRPAKLSFRCSDREHALITNIVGRAIKAGYVANTDQAIRSAVMDITACHCNGAPLLLEDMLTMPEPDFGHDFNGIQRFIDRSTGRLREFFDPRCSAPAAQPAVAETTLDLNSDTPLQSPACALDGGPCESCQ